MRARRWRGGWPRARTQRAAARGRGRASSASTAPPERIEVYDNSHIQGSDAVGAMIVAGPEGFIKSAYRKFNINDPTGARRATTSP